MYGFPGILIFFCHEWGDSAMIFTSDEVTRENNCRIARLVTKIGIRGNPYIILLWLLLWVLQINYHVWIVQSDGVITWFSTLLFKSNGIFFSNTKNLILKLCLSTWKIIIINTKCFARYIPDLIKFRNRVTAQWLPKVGHVRKTCCKTGIQVSHTKEIPVSATTH